MKHLLLALVFLAAGASRAAAQTDFTTLPLAPGDKIIITDASGIEVGGPLTTIDRAMLTIGKYQFAAEPGLKIERSGDSLVNGIAIGGGIGLLLGFAACGEYTECAVSNGVLWGLVGALVDWARVGRSTVYRVPSPPSASHTLKVAPVVTANSKGVGVSLSF